MSDGGPFLAGVVWPIALPTTWTVDVMEEWFDQEDPADERKRRIR